jgi:hypothetical protein
MPIFPEKTYPTQEKSIEDILSDELINETRQT